MGDPTAHSSTHRSEGVKHERITQAQLDLTTVNCKDFKTLAREFLGLMFTEAQLAKECCTQKSKTHGILDSEILNGMRGK